MMHNQGMIGDWYYRFHIRYSLTMTLSIKVEHHFCVNLTKPGSWWKWYSTDRCSTSLWDFTLFESDNKREYRIHQQKAFCHLKAVNLSELQMYYWNRCRLFSCKKTKSFFHALLNNLVKDNWEKFSLKAYNPV